MKICVFSDIHGNGFAFRAAYEMMLREKADQYIFLGDLCGYYFDQVEIFHMLQSMPNLIGVRGNHDEVFLRVLNGEVQLDQAYRNKYGSSMDELLDCHPTDLTKWLSTLPNTLTLPDYGITAYHGSPQDPLEGYVYPDSPLSNFATLTSDIFMLGHTHYPMRRHFKDNLIINPGSLGQPRQGGWPTYATIVMPENTVCFHEVPYDKIALVQSIKSAADKTPYLREVLNR